MDLKGEGLVEGWSGVSTPPPMWGKDGRYNRLCVSNEGE